MISSAKNTVLEYIMDKYPSANVVMLAGSTVHGNHRKGSDLDVLIFIEEGESVHYIDQKNGLIIECFVVVLSDSAFFFDAAQITGIPSILKMCIEGIIIVNDGQAEEIIKNAKKIWLDGPYPWSLDQINQYRYEITEYLEDLIHSNHKEENLFIVHKLFGLITEFVLRVNHRWIGVGKWAYRTLEEFNPVITYELIRASHVFYQSGNIDEFVSFVDDVIQPFGGRLRIGWTE